MQHVDDGRCDQGVVHRQVHQPHAQLKLREEGDGKRTIGGESLGVLRHVHHPQSCGVGGDR